MSASAIEFENDSSGPLLLARLAVETGGRLTKNTNDLSLGVARAQRDLTCRYTVGFYLSAEAQERPRRMVVRVLRDGMRAVHPGLYRFRTPEERLHDSVLAAFVEPSLFESGTIRGHVFLLQPRTPKTWDTLVAVSFPVVFEEPGQAVTVDFGAVLHGTSTVAHSFNRRAVLKPRDPTAVGERRFMFLEPAEVAPGTLELRIVRLDADGEDLPGTGHFGATIPAVERGELMLVQPILGKPRTDTILVRGDGPAGSGRKNYEGDELAIFDIVAAKGSFEPLLVHAATTADPLMARNKTCLVGKRKIPAATLERLVLLEAAGSQRELPPVPIELDGEGKISCQDLLELLPTDIGTGEYLFDARIESEEADEADRERLPYMLEEAPPPEPRRIVVPGRRPGSSR